MPLVPKHIETLAPYQAGKSIAEIKSEFKLKKIVKLASNENPMGASPRAVQAMVDSLKEINRYPNPASYDLRKALADWFDVKVDNVITLRTFSKAYGLAGIRIGYGFAHDHLIKNLMKVKLPFEPSIPAQAAGLAAMEDQEFMEEYIKLSRNGLEFFYDLFDRRGIQCLKSHANFVTIILDSEQAVNRLYQNLLCRGVIVRPLKAFGIPNGIRITTGLEQENRLLARVLKKVL